MPTVLVSSIWPVAGSKTGSDALTTPLKVGISTPGGLVPAWPVVSEGMVDMT